LTWILIGLNILPTVGFEVYPPGGFAFIPLSLMAYGMLRYKIFGFSLAMLKKGDMGKVLSYVVLIPFVLVFGGLYHVKALGITNWIAFYDMTIPDGIPALLSVLICLGMAIFCFLRGLRHAEMILFGLICFVFSLLSAISLTGQWVLPEQESSALKASKVFALIAVNNVGLFMHLVHVMAGRPQRILVYVFYGLGFGLMYLTLTPFFFADSMNHLTFGLYPQGRWGLGVLVFVILSGVLWCSYILSRVWKQSPDDRPLRIRVIYTMTGLWAYSLFCLGNIPAIFGINLLPIGDFIFIPTLMIAYGIFRHGLFPINRKTSREIKSGIVKLMIFAGYGCALSLSLMVMDPLPIAGIIERIVPYGIPPLLSFGFCLFLSTTLLILSPYHRLSHVFSGICLLFGVINLNIGVNTLISDPVAALKLARWGQALFVFIWGVCVHLCYIILRHPSLLKNMYLAYGISFLMAPFTQSAVYFQSVNLFYFGYFPHRSFLFDIMGGLWILNMIYMIYLIQQAYRNTNNVFQQFQFKVLLWAFIAMIVLTLCDLPALYGYEVYPLGGFIFMPLLLLAYGLFRNHFREIIRIVRGLIFFTGLLIILWSLDNLLYDYPNPETQGFPWKTLLIFFMFPVLWRSWNFLLSLLIRYRNDDLKESFIRMTDQLADVRRLKDIQQLICSVVFQELWSSRCTLLFLNHLPPQLEDLPEKNLTSDSRSGNDEFIGWDAFNHSTGLFGTQEGLLSNERAVILTSDISLGSMFYSGQYQISQEQVEAWAISQALPAGFEKWLLESELIQAVLFQGKLIGLILLTPKIDSMPYTHEEKAFLEKIGQQLGPYIENARILEELEHEVAERTADLQETNQLVTHQNQIIRSLFQTGTFLHQARELSPSFDYILQQLQQIFPRWQFAMLISKERPDIIEFAHFLGLSKEEQDALYEQSGEILARHLDYRSAAQYASFSVGFVQGETTIPCHVLAMRGIEGRLIVSLFIKGKSIPQPSLEIITLFLEQVTAFAESKQLTMELERIANTDGLTGTFNRLFFDKELHRAIDTQKRLSQRVFSILLIDVNGLKRVNDVFGHGAGDKMIIAVADLLLAVCRKTDVVVRLGGDEFVVLCPASGYQTAHNLLERIRLKEQQAFMTCQHPDGTEEIIPIRMSIGLASSESIDPELVMKQADHAMYADKEAFYAKRQKYR
ncbi:MAG: diguanylate cyclase, partial [SAR324 cluster bacterium]|nr:diguanylate cyclase [SAR324 cluster bacterium]